MNGLKIMFWTVCLEVACIVLKSHCLGQMYGICAVNTRHVCCSSFEFKNGKCTRCLKGYHSAINSTCKPCRNGMFGQKCRNTCTCDSNERCDHIRGCIFDGQTTKRNSGNNNTTSSTYTAITIRDLILIIIIIVLSLIILFGLLQKYRKRQRTLISPINQNEIETHEIREVEDRTESVYHEIDESAMKTLSPRQSFHHSYIEIRNSLHSTINTKAKSSSSLACVSSKLVRQTSLRRQRYSTEGSSNDINSAVRNEYSDGYLLPITRSIAKLRTLKTFSENREIMFPKLTKITSKPNDERINKESTGIGICRSMNYNKLVLKDIITTRIDIVDNPTYSATVHLDSKSTTLLSRRRTV